jgi:hypothetical protein
MSWNTDKFYRGWLRSTYISGVIMILLAMVNFYLPFSPGPHVWPLQALNIVTGIYSLGFAYWCIFNRPNYIRKSWAEMKDLDARIVEASKNLGRTLDEIAKESTDKK